MGLFNKIKKAFIKEKEEQIVEEQLEEIIGKMR